MNIERQYLSAAQVAALLRQALKESFPKARFSVRSKSYSGGASIDVSYTDGPPKAAVEAVAGAYAGSYFDGMIDYKGSRYHLLDGLHAARAAGAYGTDGLAVEEYQDWRGRPAARLQGAEGGPQVAGPDRRIMHAEAAIAAWFDLSRDPGELEAQPSREFARLQAAGDDGYGHGTTGPAVDLRAVAAEREAATLN